MGLFRNRREHTLQSSWPASPPAWGETATETAEAATEVKSEEDLKWEADVDEINSMSAGELKREALGEIVSGDNEEGAEQATMYYSRAAALANLAILKTLQDADGVSQEFSGS